MVEIMVEQQDTAQKEKKPTADEILSKDLGDAHYRIFKLKEYFDSLNDVVHYYMDKFGPYLPSEERSNIAILALEADQLYIDIYELVYTVQTIRSAAQAALDQDEYENFHVDSKVSEQLRIEINRMEERVDRFAQHLKTFIDRLIETAKREGIE